MNLEQRMRDIEEFLGLGDDMPSAFNPLALSITEHRLLRLLRLYELVPDEMAYAALYSGLPDHKQPHSDIIGAYVFRLRRKLKRRDIGITNVWGRGHSLAKEDKDKLDIVLGPIKRREAA